MRYFPLAEERIKRKMFFSHAQLGEWGQVRGEGGIDAGHMICQNPVCLLPSACPDLWRQPTFHMFLCMVKVSERLL